MIEIVNNLVLQINSNLAIKDKGTQVPAEKTGYVILIRYHQVWGIWVE